MALNTLIKEPLQTPFLLPDFSEYCLAWRIYTLSFLKLIGVGDLRGGRRRFANAWLD